MTKAHMPGRWSRNGGERVDTSLVPVTPVPQAAMREAAAALVVGLVVASISLALYIVVTAVWPGVLP